MNARMIIVGLKSENPAVAQRAVTAAQRLLVAAEEFSPQDVALLLAVQQEMDPVDGSPYEPLNKVSIYSSKKSLIVGLNP